MSNAYSTYEQVLETVMNSVAVILGVGPDEINAADCLETNFDADSTEMTELAAEIEKFYGVRIAKLERDNWTSCETISASVFAHLMRDASRGEALQLIKGDA